MSLRLVSIELSNVRCHKHILFEPDPEGITAISGENGCGKSTIVDAFAWTLYGTRVNNLRNKFLIKDGTHPKKDKIFARVTINVSGIDYLVERKIVSESGGTECNIWGKGQSDEEYKHVAGPAVSNCEGFIRQLLNMDEKGFLASVLIQQKQVDQIVSASPRERGEVIEKLTGISSITSAIAAANDEARSLQRAAQVIHIADIEAVQSLVTEQENTLTTLLEDKKTSFNELSVRQDKWKKMCTKLKRATELCELVQGLETQQHDKEVEQRLLQEQVDDYARTISEHKAQHGTVATGNKDALVREREAAGKKASEMQSEIQVLALSIKKLEDKVAETEPAPGTTLKTLQASLTETKKEFSEVSSLIETKTTDTNYNKEVLRKAEQSLKQIDEGMSACPVCKKPIDDPAALQKETEDEIKNLQSTIKAAKKEIADLKKKETALLSSVGSIETAISNLKIHNDSKKNLQSQLETKKDKEAVLQTLQSTVDAIEKQYNSFLEAEAALTSVKKAKSSMVSANKRLNALGDEIKIIDSEIKALEAPTIAEYKKQKAESDKFQAESNKLLLKYQHLEGTISLESSRLKDYRAQLTQTTEAHEQYEDIMQSIAVATNSSALMADFKKERIEYSIPTLTFFASDILNKFTGGQFVKISLDEKFNTSVTTESGQIRPIHQLSGGELSAAAIALRLGISMLLNSNRRSVLIFDEVLVSMDEGRARQIMETISTIIDCQVIFIAHNSDINSVADRTMKIQNEEGSPIV